MLSDSTGVVVSNKNLDMLKSRSKNSMRSSVENFIDFDIVVNVQNIQDVLRDNDRIGKSVVSVLTVPVIDASTGEITPVSIFVAALAHRATPMHAPRQIKRKRTG
jgi:hypothetical protein